MSSNLNSAKFASKQFRQNNYGKALSHSISSDSRSPAGEYGVRVAIKAELCSGCGDCIPVCPENALKLSSSVNLSGIHPVHYNGESCNGCGVCANVCAIPGAIRIYRRLSVS